MRAIAILLFISLFSVSILASDCKYEMPLFYGTFQVVDYRCLNTDENDLLTCYSQNDPHKFATEVHISPIPMGTGIQLSAKIFNKDFEVIEEYFFSKYNLGKNETLECDESIENGIKTQTIKTQLLGLNGTKFYTMLTKQNDKMEIEMFTSLDGVTIQKNLILTPTK